MSNTVDDPLKAGRRPLQAHAGVDVLLGQGLELAGTDAIVLGEDQVPDLDFLGAGAVVEDLRARPAHAVGPVRRRPAGQKLSSSPSREIRLAGTLISSCQMSYASSSSR